MNEKDKNLKPEDNQQLYKNKNPETKAEPNSQQANSDVQNISQRKPPSKFPVVIFASLILLIIVGLVFLKFFGGYIKNPSLLKDASNVWVRNRPTPTSSLTSNWKTYINTTYNYSIEHPPSWKQTYFSAKPRESAIQLSYSEELTKNDQQVFNSAYINIGVETNKSGENPSEEWYIERIKNIPGNPSPLPEDIQTKQSNFLGYPSLEVDNREIYFAIDILMFQINWHIEGTKSFQENAKPTINQILSTFKFIESNQEAIVKDNCKIEGCNSELCLDSDKTNHVYSICLYKPEYACYKKAVCEKQASGACGWTETEEYKSCLETVEENKSIVLNLPWEEAIEYVQNCQASHALQTHNLEVGISLLDGRSISTKEPAIDIIWDEIEKANNICKKRIDFVTE